MHFHIGAAQSVAHDAGRSEMQCRAVHEYTIQRLIGVGGSAAVFVASSGAHEVAVKVHVDQDDPVIEHEIEMLGRLDGFTGSPAYHECIVMPESSPLPGHIGIVQDLVLGEWDTFFRDYSYSDMVWYMKRLLERVDELHAHGVQHRDLWPKNIVVDSERTMHILDYDMAKPLDAGDDGRDDIRSAAGSLALLLVGLFDVEAVLEMYMPHFEDATDILSIALLKTFIKPYTQLEQYFETMAKLDPLEAYDAIRLLDAMAAGRIDAATARRFRFFDDTPEKRTFIKPMTKPVLAAASAAGHLSLLAFVLALF